MLPGCSHQPYWGPGVTVTPGPSTLYATTRGPRGPGLRTPCTTTWRPIRRRAAAQGSTGEPLKRQAAQPGITTATLRWPASRRTTQCPWILASPTTSPEMLAILHPEPVETAASNGAPPRAAEAAATASLG